MPSKKVPPAPTKTPARKKAVKKTPSRKKAVLDTSLSVPPVVNVEEIVVPTPQTHTWFAILHDGRVYKATTTFLNRVVLVTSVAVYIIAFVLAGITTLADTPTGPTADQLKNAGIAAQYTTGGGIENIGIVVAKLLQFFFGALGLAFTCYIFYAGFVWLTAAGEEDKVKKARAMIFHSILGLIVCAASFAITSAWLTGVGKFVQ